MWQSSKGNDDDEIKSIINSLKDETQLNREQGSDMELCSSFVPQQPILNTPHLIGHGISDFLIHRINNLTLTSHDIMTGISIESLGEDILFSIMEDTGQIQMEVRNALVEQRYQGHQENRRRLLEMSKIRIAVPQNALLRISLPPLVGRKYRGSYNIYFELKMALEQFFKKHRVPELNRAKLLLIYKKYSPDLSIRYTCDNDNCETKRTTNAIAEAINYSDNAANFSFLYTAVESEHRMMEATLLRIDCLPHFFDYLTCPIPAQPLKDHDNPNTFPW